jgi:predicted Zn-dependent protease
MAQLLIEMNRPAEARDQLRQALALDPSNAQARQLLEKVQGSTGTGGTP